MYVGCPHNFALSPVEANYLEKADVLIINGLGMEGFLEDSPFLVRVNLHLIDASHEIEPIYFVDDASHDHEAHGADEHIANPHGWVSPFVAARMTRWIGKRLSEIDPKNAETYKSNAEAYTAKLDSLGEEFVSSLSLAHNLRLVTFHSAFDYLVRDLNLEIVAVVLSDAGAEPSAKELAALIGEIQETRPVGIFSEPQYSDKLVRLLSEETGIPYYVLDPASSGEDDPASYLRTMNRNLETLKTAFQLENTE
jgi:ABC-type Zn uptake system ZnuABC Zn-binding protein ZnuA